MNLRPIVLLVQRARAALGRAAARSSHVSIGVRMALAFGLVLALFAGTTTYAVLQMHAIDRDLREAMQAQNDFSGQAATMRRSINDVYFNALLLVLSTQVDDIKYYAGVIPQARAAYAKAKASLLQRSGNGATVSGLAEVVARVTESEDMLLMIDQVISRRMALVGQAKPGEDLAAEESVVANLITLVKAQFDLWAKSVDELVAVSDADTAARQQRAASAARTAQGVQIVASALALAIGVLAAWWLTRNVTRPIRQAVSVAVRVAGGDLAFAIPRGGRDETGALLEALRGMQSSLNALVTDVRDAASSIVTASVEVAMGNNELSQRTESAASHLQHTSGAIDQLGKAAHQSAASAQRVDALVHQAAQAAAQGGDVAAKAVQSILAIAAQSQRIGDIVGLIEGIAFRTNILALNAAIEAAGAGEQGRGFAVVAGEVRNLAQRSAAAAKDIAALIQTSMHSVEQGSQWVRDAGDNMAAIVDAVNRVTSATQEISHATLAQSKDLGKIGTAMDEVDRMTQQNAALVEQSAAAAELLKGQSQRLTQIVAMFRLEADVPEPEVMALQP